MRAFPRLVFLSAALVSRTSAAAPADAVTITAAPSRVVLEAGARATLRVTAPEPPVIAASVGRIENVKALGHGVYEATFLPPTDTFPQVAIVTAATSRKVGWLPLPLAGTGEVAIKTKPGGMVSLSIGSARFGPARADNAGRAVIRIVVPPGVKDATSGGRRVPLNAPDVAHVYVTVDRATVPADTSATVSVRTFAVTPDGRPRRGAPVVLTVSAGKVSAAREVEPGMFEHTWTIPAGLAGALTVSAALRDEKGLSSTATVAREASIARRLRIDVDRSRIVAGDDPLEFAVTVEDGAGNPVGEVVPRITTSAGTFLGFTRGAPGRWIARVTVPERIAGDSKIDIAATAGEAQARLSVPIVPGPAADVAVEPAAIDATRGGAFTFAVATVDRFGNPTDAAPPKAVAQLGSIGNLEKQGVGLYRVTYRPPENATMPRDQVTIRSGTVEKISRVTLYTPSPSLLEITPKAGIVRRSGSFGPAAGAEVALWTLLGDQQVGLAFEGMWFAFSNTAAVPATTFSLDSKQNYLSFTLAPTWRHPLGSGVTFRASLGAGAVRVSSSSKLTGQPSIEESTWVGAGTAAASIGARLWGGVPFLELRATYVTSPSLKGVSGAFWPIFLSAGYRFDAF